VERGGWTPGNRLLTAGLVFMTTAVGFEGLAVPTVLPATLDEFGGLPLYGWAFSGFWLSNLVGIAVAGREADRRGPLAAYVAGAGLFAAGLVIAGLAPNMAWVVAGRVVQGLGAGAIASITYVLIARGYDPDAQPGMIAVVQSAWVVPGLVGPALAGYLAQEHSWRWAFLGLAPLLPLATLLLIVPVRRLGRAAGEARAGSLRAVTDAIQLAVGASLLLSAGALGHPLLAVVVAVIGLGLAARPLQTLLPAGTVVARHGRPAAVAMLALISVAFFGAEAFVPLAVSSVRNSGTIAGGLALTAAAVTWAIGSWIQARMASSGHRRALTAGGTGLVALGIGFEVVIPLTSVAPVWLAAVGWAIAGLGMGISYSMLTLASIEGVPNGTEGAAAASVQLAEALGIAVGAGITGTIVALGAVPVGLAPAIALAELSMIVVCGLAIVLAQRLAERSSERA
jgi:MFS family permease